MKNIRNFVAKYARKVNKAGAHKDKTKYCRTSKHNSCRNNL